MNLLISGYMIGSPTSDKAQCCGCIPSANLSGRTPGTPENETTPSTIRNQNVWQVVVSCLIGQQETLAAIKEE